MATMKKLLTIALAAISCSMAAQELTVQSSETELLVSARGVSNMTALQFNLSLPAGVTIASKDATMGEATYGFHTLCIETLDNGDHLFILYSMNLNTFKDGELLRLPFTVNNTAGSLSGSITAFRTATTDAVIHAGAGATFPITVTGGSTGVGAALNDNGRRINDNYYSIDGVKFSGEPVQKGVYIRNGRKVVK